MNVRIVYFEGCPNAEPAESLVREVAADLGIQANTERVEVSTPEDAVREQMYGSPTIQIEGVDVDPEKRSGEDYSFGCRVFNGAHGLPPREMLINALKEADQQS
tara:strand:+ start:91795 stop:92106 length:312 start_codon:yes stop_codon:yes gene_type:complete